MLDTNICIYTMKKNPPGVLENLKKYRPDSVWISKEFERVPGLKLENWLA